MSNKIIIVSNGLRNMCGHYYETSISLAEAARRAGWHPVLATHVDCRRELLPDWLECHPIFRTDHWMDGPPASGPAPGELSDDLYLAPWRRSLRRVAWAYRKLGWAAERSAYYLLPPVCHASGRWLARWLVPRVLRREYHPRLIGRGRQILVHWRGQPARSASEAAPLAHYTARAYETAAERPFIAEALAALRADGLEHELEHGLIFKQDLERLLALSRAGRHDHVLLGTAHARELPAIYLIAHRLGEHRAPTFHLEFRHPLFETPGADAVDSPNIRLHRAFLALIDRWQSTSRIRFYTDTRQLADDYGRLTTKTFGVLPIPFRSELIGPPTAAPGGPLQLAYLGEVRDEKGFAWLPDLIDRLMSDYVHPGRARFLVQATLSAPHYNPHSARALERLKQFDSNHVELLGLEAPLTPAAYYELASRADIVLLPYDRQRYRAASSGTLAEALAGGRATIVPGGGWMAEQLPPGAGETFDDFESFVVAVKRVIDRHPDYAARAQTHRDRWRKQHSPDALIAAIVGSPHVGVDRLRRAA